MTPDTRLLRSMDESEAGAGGSRFAMACADDARGPLVDILDNGSLDPEDRAELDLCRDALNVRAVNMAAEVQAFDAIRARLDRLQQKWSGEK
jgi:hypothetical protein